MKRVVLSLLFAPVTLWCGAVHAGGGTYNTHGDPETAAVQKALKPINYDASMRVYGYPTYQDRNGKTQQLKPDGFGGFRAPYAGYGGKRRK